MKVHIDLGCKWEVGKLNINELVYRVDELAPEILTQVIEQLVTAYQEEVTERLLPGHGSRERSGLGKHEVKGEEGRACRGRCVKKKGFRHHPRSIKSKYGMIRFRLQIVECLTCRKQYCPLLDAMKIEPYMGHEDVLEKTVADAVIDTNYRRLIDGHSLDVSLGGVHNLAQVRQLRVQNLVFPKKVCRHTPVFSTTFCTFFGRVGSFSCMWSKRSAANLSGLAASRRRTCVLSLT